MYQNKFEEEEDVSKSSKLLLKYASQQLDLKINDTFEEKSFVSYTLAPWVAANFSNLYICCLYRIKITNNCKFPYLIFPLSQSFKEFEVLLNPSKFRVIDIHTIKSKYSPLITMKIYDLEYVSDVK